MYTETIPKSADWIVFTIFSSAELTLQNQPILLPALLFYFTFDWSTVLVYATL